MAVTKHVQMGEAKEKELAKLVKKLAEGKETFALDRRTSYREADKKGDVAWQAYARFLVIKTGHTMYINLRTMEGTVSSKPDRHAEAKYERHQKKAAKRLEREEIKAAKKEAEHFDKVSDKVLRKAGTALAKSYGKEGGPSVTRQSIPEIAGVSASSKKHNARKAKTTVKPEATVNA